MTYSPSDVFVDYLTVTNRPDNSCSQDVTNYLLSRGAFFDSDYNGKVSIYLDPIKNRSALVQIRENSSFVGISATGSALHHLREHGFFLEYLDILASVPHNVTRLDAALDSQTDAPPVLNKILSAYPTGEVNITRKSVKIKRLFSTREDGLESGTIYFGDRGKSIVTARIYDKQLERLEKAGVLIPPTVRYELQFARGFSTSLKDASNPYLLFWNHAHSFNLDIPKNLPPWVPGGEYVRYEKVSKPELLPYQKLSRRVERSMELQSLFIMAQELGVNGTQTLLSLIRKKFDTLGAEHDSEQ